MGEQSGWDGFRFNRRDFIKYSLATTVAVWAGSNIPAGLGIDRAEAQDLFSVEQSSQDVIASVFPQSIASGDPQPRGIVLWSRINPRTIAYRQRRRRRKNSNHRRRRRRIGTKLDLNVAYQVAEDQNFDNVVLSGVLATSPERDYTVKTQLNDSTELNPFTTYYYRFIYGGVPSRTGRFKTLPASDDPSLSQIRLGYTSCQDYTNGYYHALRYLAEEEIDYVVHLGDYIYETTSEDSFQGGGPPDRQFTLPSGRDRAEDLNDYRFLYKKYKSDPDLQLLHERYATINIWDDHEFANDCYQEYDTDSGDPSANYDPQRRQDANRAWAEYVPAGVPYEPAAGPLDEIKIYRSFEFGKLAELVMTDERLYRDAQPCGVETSDKYFTPGCGTEEAEERTMLGDEQKQWFLDRITDPDKTWKLWGNETMVMQFKVANTYADQLPGVEFPEGGDVYVNLDQWDGYQKEREDIALALRDKGVKNFVVMTGDLHSSIAGYLRVDYDSLTPPQEDAVGVCFMASSVTSANLTEIATRLGYLGPGATDFGEISKASNPHIEFFNSETHGYNILTVTPEELTCEMVSVNPIKTPEGALRTPLRTFTVPQGQYLITETPVAAPV